MNKFNFSGSYYDIGYQKGLVHKKNGLSDLQLPILFDILKKQKIIYKKFYPNFLEELEGIAESTKSELEQIEYLFLVKLNMKWLEKGCTIFSLVNKNGVLIGRNYDWLPPTENVASYYYVNIEGKHNYVAFSDMDYPLVGKLDKRFLVFSSEDAINEHGLFVGLTFAYHLNRGFGISNTQAIRWIAENCKNTKEAVKFLKKVKISMPKNLFIADSSGNAVVFEHSSAKKKIISPENGCLIKTNHFLNKELSKDPQGSFYPNSMIRYRAVKKQLERKMDTLALSQVINVLNNREVYANRANRKTIWQLALNLKDKNYWLYAGGRKIRIDIPHT